jgi:hypothetical protein
MSWRVFRLYGLAGPLVRLKIQGHVPRARCDEHLPGVLPGARSTEGHRGVQDRRTCRTPPVRAPGHDSSSSVRPRRSSQLPSCCRTASRYSAIADLETLALALGDRLGHGEISLARYDTITAPLDKRLAELRDKRAAIGTPDTVPTVSAAIFRQRWNDAEPAERRELLHAALRGRKLAVGPADRHGPAALADVVARITIA